MGDDLAGRMASLDAEREITRVLHQYCHGIDRLDRSALEAVYHPDATDDHGVFVGTATEFIDYVLDRLSTVYSATQHCLSNITVRSSGDLAVVESYVVAHHVVTRSHRDSLLYTFTGRYVDRFEKRGGSWRIAHRQLLRTWDGLSSGARQVPGGGTFSLPAESLHHDGFRSAQDPSYPGLWS